MREKRNEIMELKRLQICVRYLRNNRTKGKSSNAQDTNKIIEPKTLRRGHKILVKLFNQRDFEECTRQYRKNTDKKHSQNARDIDATIKLNRLWRV